MILNSIIFLSITLNCKTVIIEVSNNCLPCTMANLKKISKKEVYFIVSNPAKIQFGLIDLFIVNEFLYQHELNYISKNILVSTY